MKKGLGQTGRRAGKLAMKWNTQECLWGGHRSLVLSSASEVRELFAGNRIQLTLSFCCCCCFSILYSCPDSKWWLHNNKLIIKEPKKRSKRYAKKGYKLGSISTFSERQKIGLNLPAWMAGRQWQTSNYKAQGAFSLATRGSQAAWHSHFKTLAFLPRLYTIESCYPSLSRGFSEQISSHWTLFGVRIERCLGNSWTPILLTS